MDKVSVPLLWVFYLAYSLLGCYNLISTQGVQSMTWHEKFIIGLTGNIATGKSVVRRMLEHLGAYSIDADQLSHRAIAKGAPGYQKVLDLFGNFILGPDGEIDRKKLGGIVFSDPAALQQLEYVIHPMVQQATNYLVSKTSAKVVVIEAIKLLESPMRQKVDSLWVVSSEQEKQIFRMVSSRRMDRSEALKRIKAQSPQSEKIKEADFVIRNNNGFEDTWNQVYNTWLTIFSKKGTQPDPSLVHPSSKVTDDTISVERARPSQAGVIARFITEQSKGARSLSKDDIMAAFGEKAYMLVKKGENIAALIGWQVENLVARTDDLYLSDLLDHTKSLKLLIEDIERHSRELQAEACLVFLAPGKIPGMKIWKDLGYEPSRTSEIKVSQWKEAAREAPFDDAVILFKQLRVDRVLRPI